MKFCACVAVCFGVFMAVAQPAVESVPRQGIGNFLAKVRAGESVTVAYLGGSITEMNGWRNLTTAWLRETYPQAKVKEVAAAIGGTGSDLGVFRVGHDALDHKPDLLFVEFATNDGNAKAENIVRQMEGIVRQTWRRNPKTDIVFVYTITVNSAKAYLAGEQPPAVVAMEQVAAHYGIPSVDFGPRVAADVKAGRLVMSMKEVETAVPVETPDRDKAIAAELAKEGKVLFAKDGVHPAMPGHGYYLESLKAAFGRLAKPKGVNHAKALAKPLRKDNLEHAKMVPITREMLTGDWSLSEEMNKNARFVGRMGPIWETKTPGAKLSFTFKGTTCRLYDLLGPDAGQVWVTVDGVRRETVQPRFDSYCTYHRMANLWICEAKEGVHTVEIELDRNQPSRQPVAFRLKNPEAEFKTPKYDNTRFWPAALLLVGEAVLEARSDTGT